MFTGLSEDQFMFSKVGASGVCWLPVATGTQPTGSQMGMQNLYYISGLCKDTGPNLSKYHLKYPFLPPRKHAA
jgi:hypothetical protein